MLIGKEFHVNTETEVMLILAGRKKKVNKVNTKLNMPPRSTRWIEGPKSKVP